MFKKLAMKIINSYDMSCVPNDDYVKILKNQYKAGYKAGYSEGKLKGERRKTPACTETGIANYSLPLQGNELDSFFEESTTTSNDFEKELQKSNEEYFLNNHTAKEIAVEMLRKNKIERNFTNLQK